MKVKHQNLILIYISIIVIRKVQKKKIKQKKYLKEQKK